MGNLNDAKRLKNKYHSGKKRLNGEYYEDHIDHVIALIADNKISNDKLEILANLDHMPYTEDTSKEVMETFGKDIYKDWILYQTLAKQKTTQIELTRANQSKIVQTFINLSGSPEVMILRLANKVENMFSTKVHDKEFAYKVGIVSLNVYAPVASLTGFNRFAYTLENEGLKLVNTPRYYKILNYIKENEGKLNDSLSDISEFIQKLAKENNIEVRVQSRIKSTYSIHKKMEKLKTSQPRDVYDIIAVRCIVPTTNDCYALESLLNSVLDSKAGSRDDYIINPKASGYMSIHNVYKMSGKLDVEVQIRTQDMHDKNEFGIASHFLYKHSNFRKFFVRDQDFLRDLNYFEGGSVDMGKFSEKIYVFTPKNDIIELPRTSTVLDFAFAIHDDIGKNAVAGFVNGKPEKLDYHLETGDKVEIKTSKIKKSTDAKLIQTVKTKKAKQNLKKINL